jgi:hypothetical protein
MAGVVVRQGDALKGAANRPGGERRMTEDDPLDV